MKRAYDVAAPSDGYRVLVDRVWPRGITKKELRIEAWLKELSPSTGLRKWFDHDPAKWKEFKERYFRELDSQSEAVQALLSKAETITLLFGARDMRHNNAVALKVILSGINEVMVANRVCGPIHLVGEEISITASLEPIHVDGNLQSTFFILWICSTIRPHGQLSKTVGKLSELVARYRLAPELLMVPAIPEGVKANSALPL